MGLEDPDVQRLTERVKAIKRAHEAELLAKANVVGVGIGYRQVAGQPTRELALVVMVSQKQPVAQLAEQDRIPREIDGIPVDVQEVGPLRAF